MRSSTFSYILCGINVLVALVGALGHDLFLLLLGFFFAVFNWYIGEFRRGIENETNKDRESTDSNRSNEDDETED